MARKSYQNVHQPKISKDSLLQKLGRVLPVQRSLATLLLKLLQLEIR